MSPDPLATLRDAMTRVRNREGVPMIVALTDERGAAPAARCPEVRADGSALAARMTDAHQGLGGSLAESDNGAVITALVITAHHLTQVWGPND